MGGFYGSVQLRTGDRAAALAAAEAVARAMKIKCLVGPPLNGWVGVYPEGNGQDHTVGQRIAAAVGGHALHLLVHDDDVLAYWLWHDGQLVDRYWSAPGYFGEENRAEEEPLVGDVERFAFVLDEAGRGRLRDLLRRDEGPTFEYERLGELGRALGIANAVSAYEYLNGGETDDVVGWPRRFKEVPASRVKTERKRRNAEADRIATERQRLRDAGLLLVSDERTDRGPIGCAAADGFVVVWPDQGQGGGTQVEYHRPPWDKPMPADGLELPPNPHVTDLGADASGRRLAMACGKCVRLWDWIDGRWRHVTDVPERDLTIGVGLSRDGRRVAHLSRSEVVVTDVAAGRTLVNIGSGGDVREVTFSPDGKWLAVAGHALQLVPLDDPAAGRHCLVGGARPVVPRSPEVVRPAGPIDVEAVMAVQRASKKKLLAKLSTTATPEELADMRARFDLQLAENRERYLKQNREGPPARQRVGRESCFCAGFDPAGRWLWIGTTAGLRVYDWLAVIAGSGDELPPPIHKADLPLTSRTPPERQDARYIYTAVGEPGGGGIVFGGLSDELFRLDLATGSVRRLATTPGGGNINALSMRPDGSAIGVVSYWWTMETIRRQQKSRQAWEVYAYPQLLATAT